MINATEYREKKERLLTEYEQKVRSWLREKNKGELADNIPFFRDGVVCPEVWFQEGNDFRPLFILKEVSIGINDVSKLDSYLEYWGNTKCFEFVENYFDDIRIGSAKSKTWKKIAKLAKGMYEIHSGKDKIDYNKYNFDFITGGEKYAGSIPGYLKEFSQRTANQEYIDIIDRIAVIDLKKVGGGTKVESKLSLEFEHYTNHISQFSDLLCEQIKLIDPTVIVCCGYEFGRCTSALLDEIKQQFGSCIWMDQYHPAYWRISNEIFFDEFFDKYKRECCAKL